MFTPLPTDAVALTAVAPHPAPSTDGPRDRLVALAEALRESVAVHLSSPDGDGSDGDGSGGDGSGGDGSDGDGSDGDGSDGDGSDGDGSDGDGPDGRRPGPGAGATVLTVTPRTSDEVAHVLRGAREHGVRVAVPAGGCTTGTSTDGAVRLSTAALDHLTVLPVLARAHVGPGVRWAELVEAAASFGLAPVPVRGSVAVVGDLVGTRADDGIGGGAPDGLRAVDVVTPDGTLRRASPTDAPDLFRALHVRSDAGDAGMPGVVVALELDLVEATSV